MSTELMTLLFRRILPALMIGLPCLSACGAPSTQAEGIHIHKKGTSPSLAKIANVQFKAAKEQCEGMRKLCQQGLPNPALCAMTAGGFKSNGDASSVGNYETDEYFSGASKMAAEWRTTTVMVAKSICETEFIEQATVKIRHYLPNSRVQYELKHSKKKGDYWLRSEQKSPDEKSASLLSGIFPLTANAKVSPVLKTGKYAGHSCEVREVTGPLSGTFCMKSTGASFPAQVTLAGTLRSGDEILSDDEATRVDMKVALPNTHFYPPVGAKIVNLDAAASSADNPTQKWCLAQKAKTGVNPCTDEANGDEK